MSLTALHRRTLNFSTGGFEASSPAMSPMSRCQNGALKAVNSRALPGYAGQAGQAGQAGYPQSESPSPKCSENEWPGIIALVIKINFHLCNCKLQWFLRCRCFRSSCCCCFCRWIFSRLNYWHTILGRQANFLFVGGGNKRVSAGDCRGNYKAISTRIERRSHWEQHLEKRRALAAGQWN